MHINLTTKLKQISLKVRRNEEDYLGKFKELGLEDSHRMTPSDKSSKNDFLEMSMTDNILQKRDVEINNLVTSINDLAHIFKELGNLVEEQGTILDRIDFNIEYAISNVKKGNENLVKAAAIQEKK